MGLTMTAKNSKYNFNMSYFGFNRLRSEIAEAYDDQFGALYNFGSKIHDDKIYKEYIETINNLLKKDRFKNKNKDILDFLFASDQSGSITPKTCKNIYNLIKDFVFLSNTFMYDDYSDGKDYEHFKDFLKECYENNEPMIWN